MKGSFFGAPMIPNLEVTFWKVENASPSKTRGITGHRKNTMLLISPWDTILPPIQKSPVCWFLSVDIGTCWFDTADATAATVLLIKSFAPEKAREKETHLPWKRWGVPTCTNFLEAKMASHRFANVTTVFKGRMKACLAVSTTRPSSLN